MSEDRKKKIAVNEREYIWVQDVDAGGVVPHFGPTSVNLTQTERCVVDDSRGGFIQDPNNTPQRLIEVGNSQYAVLHNPLETNESDTPNGQFSPGKSQARKLSNGTTQIIAGPTSFFLWPGQRADVRDSHELSSDQFLKVRVVNEKIDTDAPYYQVTAQAYQDEPNFKRGDLLVITGVMTQLYIPPTGIEIVPDMSVDNSGVAISAADAAHFIEDRTYGLAENAFEQEAQLTNTPYSMGGEDVSDFATAGAAKRRKASGDPERRRRVFEALARNAQQSTALQAELQKRAKSSRLVRNAVVLKENEFCVLVDADGRRKVKKGPDRVFPDAYDRFQTEGSEDRVYRAYHLRPERALWLRVISQISREDLVKNLPPKAEACLEEGKDIYFPGDYILLRSLTAFFIPFNEIEVLSPVTGDVVVGNDHERVLIEAVGIDQKSGIYVRDLETGEVRLVRGKRSYLIDPRRESHVPRVVTMEDWNHWILGFRKHKEQASGTRTTPWALSIKIPDNYAALAAGAEGQRVIKGPSVHLLEFDEKLTILGLSTGTPKTDTRLLKTAFLKTRGNRISDVITVETSDLVEVNVRISAHVNFDESLEERWFSQENPIQFLVERLRSMVRHHGRKITLEEFYPNHADILRDLILGQKVEGEEERPGRLLTENGMKIFDLEVLEATIVDATIRMQYEEMQRTLVQLQIGDKTQRAKLESERVREEVAAASQAINREAKERNVEFEALVRQLDHQATLESQELAHKRRLEEIQKKALRELDQLEAELDRAEKQLVSRTKEKIKVAKADADALNAVNTAKLAFERDQAEINASLIKARSDATVAENESVQPGFVEALAGHGDKVLLKEAAQNMNLVSLVKGQSIGQVLSGVFGGTKIATTLANLSKRVAKPAIPAND